MLVETQDKRYVWSNLDFWTVLAGPGDEIAKYETDFTLEAILNPKVTYKFC